jgi:dipeptidyl aminopeptidase/acylaminoacyl peptidase
MAETPYGEWPSPLDAATVAADSLEFGHVALDGEVAYWLERRPEEDGRGVVVRAAPGESPTEVTPEDHDVRTLVHEYGGGDFAVRDGAVVYARFEDQRLYRTSAEATPSDADDATTPAAADAVPITPEPPTERGARYADVEFVPGEDRIYCVRERHYGEDAEAEAVNELVAVDLADSSAASDAPPAPEVVASGHDFHAFPRLSPDGDRLAWTTWDHPWMPWDGTELHVARVDDDGGLAAERTVMGGPEESVFQPEWSPDGELYAVSDRTGWWNLYRLAGAADVGATGAGSGNGGAGDAATVEPEPAREEATEYGTPQWVFGLSTYAFLDDGRIAAVRRDRDEQAFGLLDPADGSFDERPAPVEEFQYPRLFADGDTLLAVGGGPTRPASVVRWSFGSDSDVLRRSFDVPVESGYLSDPEAVTVPTSDGETTHAYYYPPTNPDVEPPAGERPPLVTVVHGGPTSRTDPVLDLSIQFFTTRGFAVADVNYRGSTGYGRAYRDRLDGEWGVVDVADCVDAARHLAEEGLADPDRLAIRGGSAGGFATLAALAFHEAFDAGASYYGVADLRALAEHTHKFESRYLDGLVGPLPDAADVYEARSPAVHADRIDAPLLVLQGGEDRVVPPEQAERMVESLVESATPYAYVEFTEERHGFRRAAAREHALATELGFYAAAFDLTPPGAEPLALSRGEYRKDTVSVVDD